MAAAHAKAFWLAGAGANFSRIVEPPCQALPVPDDSACSSPPLSGSLRRAIPVAVFGRIVVEASHALGSRSQE